MIERFGQLFEFILTIDIYVTVEIGTRNSTGAFFEPFQRAETSSYETNAEKQNNP